MGDIETLGSVLVGLWIPKDCEPIALIGIEVVEEADDGRSVAVPERFVERYPTCSYR